MLSALLFIDNPCIKTRKGEVPLDRGGVLPSESHRKTILEVPSASPKKGPTFQVAMDSKKLLQTVYRDAIWDFLSVSQMAGK